MTLQMTHGYKRDKNGMVRPDGWKLVRIESDLTVTPIGKLSRKVAEALKAKLTYGD